jgi:hypothetical protein
MIDIRRRAGSFPRAQAAFLRGPLKPGGEIVRTWHHVQWRKPPNESD